MTKITYYVPQIVAHHSNAGTILAPHMAVVESNNTPQEVEYSEYQKAHQEILGALEDETLARAALLARCMELDISVPKWLLEGKESADVLELKKKIAAMIQEWAFHLGKLRKLEIAIEIEKMKLPAGGYPAEGERP